MSALITSLASCLFANAALVLVLTFALLLTRRFIRQPALFHAICLLLLVKLVTPSFFKLELPVAAPALLVAAAEAPVAETDVEFVPDAVLLEESLPGPQPGRLGTEPRLSPAEIVARKGGASGEELPRDWTEEKSSAPLGFAFQDYRSPEELDMELASSSSLAKLELPRLSLMDWLLLVWALGSALVLLRHFLLVARFRCLLRYSVGPGLNLQRVARRLSRKLGLTRLPEIRLLDAPISPMIWSPIGQTRLLLPLRLFSQLSDEERESLLAHELTHLMRKDHWVRRLELIVAAVFWWNPGFWILRRELRRVEEECCDARVLWSLPNCARTYAEALLKVVDHVSAAGMPVPPAATGAGYADELKRRLTMIMEEKRSRGLNPASRTFLVALGAVVLPALPAFAQQSTVKGSCEKKACTQASAASQSCTQHAKKSKSCKSSTKSGLSTLRQKVRAADIVLDLESVLQKEKNSVVSKKSALIDRIRSHLADKDGVQIEADVEVLDLAKPTVGQKGLPKSLELQVKNLRKLKDLKAKLKSLHDGQVRVYAVDAQKDHGTVKIGKERVAYVKNGKVYLQDGGMAWKVLGEPTIETRVELLKDGDVVEVQPLISKLLDHKQHAKKQVKVNARLEALIRAGKASRRRPAKSSEHEVHAHTVKSGRYRVMGLPSGSSYRYSYQTKSGDTDALRQKLNALSQEMARVKTELAKRTASHEAYRRFPKNVWTSKGTKKSSKSKTWNLGLSPFGVQSKSSPPKAQGELQISVKLELAKGSQKLLEAAKKLDHKDLPELASMLRKIAARLAGPGRTIGTTKRAPRATGLRWRLPSTKGKAPQAMELHLRALEAAKVSKEHSHRASQEAKEHALRVESLARRGMTQAAKEARERAERAATDARDRAAQARMRAREATRRADQRAHRLRVNDRDRKARAARGVAKDRAARWTSKSRSRSTGRSRSTSGSTSSRMRKLQTELDRLNTQLRKLQSELKRELSTKRR